MSTAPHTRNRRLTPLEGARLLRAWHQRGNVLQSTFCLLNGVSAPTLRRWLRKAALFMRTASFSPTAKATNSFFAAPTWATGW